MGLDLTLCMADWARWGEVPVERRIDALTDALWQAECEDDDHRNGPPRRSEPAWCAEYVFRTTTGSYRPHSRAGDAWDDLRPLVEAPLRAAMDTFLDGLIWDSDPADDPALTGGGGFLPPGDDPWRPRVLLVCPPTALPDKARAWQRAEPRLAELRGPFAAECEGWAGRPATFEEFTALLREWGEATTEAARRGWGLVGLP
ncbi:hypothetical protein [Streptomyces sp. NPDC048606]|uniref:hypothetical protein n=1 Tax=Streptomyces sp. NPDC048606 TaxID=3154726 RepID=UPI003429145A